MTKQKNATDLTRRERQVMDIVYARGRVSVADVQADLADNPTYSATRMLMQRLHKRGLITFDMDGARYIYSATTPRTSAVEAAWSRLVKTFFDGSNAAALSTLLGASSDELSDAQLAELEDLVARAKARKKQ